MPFFPPLDDCQAEIIYRARTEPHPTRILQRDTEEPNPETRRHGAEDREPCAASPVQNRDITSIVTENCISPHARAVPVLESMSLQVGVKLWSLFLIIAYTYRLIVRVCMNECTRMYLDTFQTWGEF
jgi:hypothetical protein